MPRCLFPVLSHILYSWKLKANHHCHEAYIYWWQYLVVGAIKHKQACRFFFNHRAVHEARPCCLLLFLTGNGSYIWLRFPVRLPFVLNAEWWHLQKIIPLERTVSVALLFFRRWQDHHTNPNIVLLFFRKPLFPEENCIVCWLMLTEDCVRYSKNVIITAIASSRLKLFTIVFTCWQLLVTAVTGTTHSALDCHS